MGNPLERFQLHGRTAVITGGSRGLGLEMARAFAELGADVMIASRKEDACRAIAAEIARDTGRKVVGVGCHVGKWGEVEKLAEVAYREFGKVDVLVNNAGMSLLYPSVDAVTEQIWDKVVDLNLKGPFRLTALVGTRMVRDGRGSIINISSTGAIRPTGDVIPYAAAKAGLEAMTVGFARAFGPNVRVNAIQAGPFFTDISKAWDMDTFLKNVKVTHALKRGGEPDEIVGAAVYLASDASSFTTATVLKVDGGGA